MVVKHVAFFTFCPTLTMAFTSVSRYGCGFGFEQKYWQIDRFGRIRSQTGRVAYPYSLPLYNKHECV